MSKKWFAGVAAAVALTACTTSPTGRSQLMVISPESAIVQSEAAYLSTMGEFDQAGKIVRDPALVERVRGITGRIVTMAVAQYPKTKDWKWSVAVVDEPETLNAWCMAGGRMAIYTGIIQKLNLTDDEIAQIMGHEISHAIANHTAERMSNAMLINAGLIAAAVASDQNQYALAGAAIAAKLALELPNSRTSEAEADRIGIELASRAGYAPEAAVSLWKKMSEAGSGGTPEFLSTHPAPENRADTLGKLAPEMRKLNPTGAKAEIYPVEMVK